MGAILILVLLAIIILGSMYGRAGGIGAIVGSIVIGILVLCIMRKKAHIEDIYKDNPGND